MNGAPALPDFTEPFGRIDLAGITLNLFGSGGLEGINHLLTFGAKLGTGDPNDGANIEVDSSGDTLLAGQGVPYGWLVTPHDGTGLTAADVEAIVARGIAEADQVRAQIRLPFNSTAKMVFAVSDENGNILGLYRMPDATYFSIGVAVAKARNVAYYDNPSSAPADRQDQRRCLPARRSPRALSAMFPCLAFPRASTSTDPGRARSSPTAA